MRVGYFVYKSDGLQDYNGVTDRVGLGYDELLKVTSINTGNLAFKYGARKLFSDEVVYLTYSSDPDWVKDNVDILVLPEANLVNPQIDYGHQANFVRRVDKPVLLCGVGSQAKIDMTPKEFPIIPAGTVKFLQEVSLRTPSILVRGDFTRDVLATYGIDNATPLGCPSYMINSNPKLWAEIVANGSKDVVLDRLSVTEGIYGAPARSPILDRVERFLFEFVRYRDADYVGQMQSAVLQWGLGFDRRVNRTQLGHLNSYIANMSVRDFESLLKNRSQAFARIDEWIAYMGKRSGVVGSRIHGNMMGIQAGIPSLPVVHDLRVKELTDTMAIPAASLDDIADLSRLEDLKNVFQAVVFESDVNSLDRRREEIAMSYLDVVEEIGLTASSHLKSLAGTELDDHGART
ncbi:polysaccharide pyruvyl transferase family protein [Zhihengliuella somnathii]